MKAVWAVGAAVVLVAALGVLVLRADPAQPAAAPAPVLTQEAVERAGFSVENAIILRRIERKVGVLEQRYEARR